MTKPDRFSAVDASGQQLRGNLDRLAGDGRRFLQRWRMGEELRSAASLAPLALFVFPLLWLLMRLTQWLLGVPQAPVDLWMVLLLALCGPLLYVLARVAIAYYRYHPRRYNSLALYDAELNTQDRLVTADEFLDEPARSDRGGDDKSLGFRQAAVADAAAHARAALTAQLTPLSLPQWRVRRVSWIGASLLVIVVALLMLVDIGSPVGTVPSRQKPALVASQSAADPAPQKQSILRRLARRFQEGQRDPLEAEMKQQKVEPLKARQSREAKATEGQSNTGNSAMAQSSSTSSTAAGEPSNQKNASKPKKPEAEKPEEPTDDQAKKRKKPAEQQKAAQMAMEATSGQGKTSMSKSSPTQFNMPEEEDKAGMGSKQDGKDVDAEDEDEEEKANSANKPTLRDKRGLMSRNLTQAFTRMKNPKPSNGRGGPTPLKKSRGVPSLILGLPVQDRLQGMLNAGRSKVTQEETKPKEESHASIDAEIRLARNEEAGHLAHPDMLPWMRMLVTDYFVSLRQRSGLLGDAGSSTTEAVSGTKTQELMDDES